MARAAREAGDSDGAARREGEEQKRCPPDFTLSLRDPAPVPVLIAVPHAGRDYPAAVVQAMRNHPVASLRLEDRFADLLADAVARETGAAPRVAAALRALIGRTRLSGSN